MLEIVKATDPKARNIRLILPHGLEHSQVFRGGSVIKLIERLSIAQQCSVNKMQDQQDVIDSLMRRVRELQTEITRLTQEGEKDIELLENLKQLTVATILQEGDL